MKNGKFLSKSFDIPHSFRPVDLADLCYLKLNYHKFIFSFSHKQEKQTNSDLKLYYIELGLQGAP